jgi:hypothetical protein
MLVRHHHQRLFVAGFVNSNARYHRIDSGVSRSTNLRSLAHRASGRVT